MKKGSLYSFTETLKAYPYKNNVYLLYVPAAFMENQTLQLQKWPQLYDTILDNFKQPSFKLYGANLNTLHWKFK